MILRARLCIASILSILRLHWLRITERIEYITSSSHLPAKFSQITNLRTFITSSLFNVLAVLAQTLLLLLSHISVLSEYYWLLHSLCFTLSLVSTPFISLSTSIILVPVHPFPTHLFLHTSLLSLLIHHSAHPLLLLFHSRLKTCVSKILSPVLLLLPSDCLHGLLPWPFLLSYSIFFKFFPCFFVSVPCAR